MDELLKQRAHVAEIGFQRDAVGVRFCAANERAQVFDRMADDIDFAVAGHLFIQQRRTPVDFVEIVFERMGDILRVALQNFAAAAAPIIGFPAQTHAPDALAKGMIQKENQNEQHDGQLNLPDFAQV